MGFNDELRLSIGSSASAALGSSSTSSPYAGGASTNASSSSSGHGSSVRKRKQRQRSWIMIALFGFMAVALGGLFWRSLTWLLFGPNADDFVVQRHGVSVRSPSAELAPFDRTAARSARNLILVACHSITVGESLEGADVRDDRWMLVDYQKHASMPQAFTGHIRKGIELALEDPHALVIFSGGQTRLHAGPKSEANSYFFVADHFGWWSSRAAKEVRPRAALEEYSTDSLENLLFSLCRFHELSGSYPKHVTVVGYTFKQERFRDLHRAALRYPLESFRYVGVDPDTNAFRARLPQLEFFESTASLAPFREDPYGCHSEVLRTKRVDRNPFSRQPGFILSCPEISTLLRYCERKLYPVGELPWDS